MVELRPVCIELWFFNCFSLATVLATDKGGCGRSFCVGRSGIDEPVQLIYNFLSGRHVALGEWDMRYEIIVYF